MSNSTFVETPIFWEVVRDVGPAMATLPLAARMDPEGVRAIPSRSMLEAAAEAGAIPAPGTLSGSVEIEVSALPEPLRSQPSPATTAPARPAPVKVKAKRGPARKSTRKEIGQ